MQVTKQLNQFTPIIITLESQEEVDQLIVVGRLVGSYTGTNHPAELQRKLCDVMKYNSDTAHSMTARMTQTDAGGIRIKANS